MARRTATAALAGISEGMCIPQRECRPIPCRNPALRSGLRRGLGRTAHSAIGTHFGGSRGASAALDPGLRPFAYAGSAPLPWRHPSRLRRHRVSPLIRYACTLVLPMPHYASQACRYHSIAAGGRCCWHTPLRLCLRERFTLTMPCSQWCTGSPLVPHQRQRGVQFCELHVVVCPAMLAHHREQAASCHTDTRSSARASVPQSASHRSSPSPPLRFGVRAANQHGTQPDGANRSPTYPPLCDDGFAYRFPQNTHCFSSWTRRTATTNHCADILCRHSRLQGECRP